MSATDPGWLSHETVCATDWKCQVTVAVPPDRATVIEFGSNAKEASAVTLPLADGVDTVTVCDPDLVMLPSVIDAEIDDVPFATPLTTPVVASTVAAAVLDDDQVGAGAPENTAPVWSFGVAVSVVVPPTTTVGEAGVTTTDVNTGVGPVVVPPPLPPHANIVAATLPTAMVRTTLRNMA